MLTLVSSQTAQSDITLVIPPPIDAAKPFWNAVGSNTRSIQTVDLNGDGAPDIFIEPSYYDHGQPLAPIVLLNDGAGHFHDGTATVFATLPLIGLANGLFINHFTSDGRLGMFIIDQGLEIGNASVGGFKGAQNQFWLQDSNGVFQDMTARIPHNGPAFNHVSTAIDMNGDGNLDILSTSLGGPALDGSGTFLYLGDGKGNFTFSVAGLPEEIKYLSNADRNWQSKTIDYQFSGSAGSGDFNRTGREDLVTGSYTGGDLQSGLQTVRVFQHNADGNFVEAFRSREPDALLKAVGVMGVAGIETGDLNGDGLPDIVLHWETGATAAVEIFRNMGNYQFKDVTTESLGSYLVRDALQKDSTGSYQPLNSLVRISDVNHDGSRDLVISSGSPSAQQLATGAATGAFLYLNDGTGKFTAAVVANANGAALTSAQLATATGRPEYGLGVPLTFDANQDGKSDQVFVSSDTAADGTTHIHVATLFGADPGTIYIASEVGDNITGSAGSDRISGGRGADHFYGLQGSDTIDGGVGADTLVLAGKLARYAVTNTGAGFAVADLSSAANTARITNIERLQFADMSMNLGVGDVARSISTAQLSSLVELYIAYLNRVPDADGMTYWIGQFKGGATLAQIGESFYSAAIQYAGLTGYSSMMSNDDFVRVVYKNVLGRTTVDADGLKYWSTALASGKESHGSLVGSILGSAHTFKGNATYGIVADLLDNKIMVGTTFAISDGLVYNTPEDSIQHGMAIAAAITPTDATVAIGLVGLPHAPGLF